MGKKINTKTDRAYSRETATKFFSDGDLYEVYTTNHSFRKGEEYIYNKYFHKNASLLDVGCGGGRTTLLIYKYFRNVVGLDINKKLIKFAKKQAESDGAATEFIIGDATNLSICDKQYDNILFSYNGIESIPSKKARNKCLKEIYRVLKPDGIFIFTTHTLFSFVYIGFHIKKILNIYSRMIPFIPILFREFNHLKLGDIFLSSGATNTVLHMTNPFRMISRLKKCGFKIIYVNSCERIARNLSPSLSSLFGTHSVFYVAKKNN